MPEPVVIIGPAAGPAGASPDHPEDAASSAASDQAPEVEVKAAGPGAAQRILALVYSILRRAFKGVTKLLSHVVWNYPRHSIAAAASLVILGAISYTQTRSGDGRSNVKNEIPGNQASSGDSAKSEAVEKEKAAAAAKPIEPDKEKLAANEKAISRGVETGGPSTAQTGAGASANLPAPKPDSNEPGQPAANALVQAGATDKAAEKTDLAQAPLAASSDPLAVPLPAPGGESTKATLLSGGPPIESGGNPAPPPSSLSKDEKNTSLTPKDVQADSSATTKSGATALPAGQTVAGKEATEVPPELWLPEGAPKAAADDGKTDKKTETAIAAAPSGESKAADPPKSADGSGGTPVQTPQIPADPDKGTTDPAPPSTSPSDQAKVQTPASATRRPSNDPGKRKRAADRGAGGCPFAQAGAEGGFAGRRADACG